MKWEIVQVKERVLPELNDEFAKGLRGGEPGEAARRVRRDHGERAEVSRAEACAITGARCWSRVQFELPESMVMSETKNVIYDVVRENQQRGITEIIDRQRMRFTAMPATAPKNG